MDSRLRRSVLRTALRASVGSQARLGVNFGPLPPEGSHTFVSCHTDNIVAVSCGLSQYLLSCVHISENAHVQEHGDKSHAATDHEHGAVTQAGAQNGSRDIGADELSKALHAGQQGNQ